jgi:hypothetical protein
MDIAPSVLARAIRSLRIHFFGKYIGKSGDFISVEDHQQQFGLSSPYDAEQNIQDKIVGKEIKRVEWSSETGDLTLVLDDGRIEIICTSAGYEAYQLYGPDNLIMVGRGGSKEMSEPVDSPKGLSAPG